MKLSFYKYQGTGNDFVIVDNRSLQWSPGTDQVARICDRKLGVGADGFILIQNHDKCDFEMVYFNSDGSKSLCGNGSRCAIHFAKYLQIIENDTAFLTTDGVHKGHIFNDEISFELFNVKNIISYGEDQFINTGSPHYLAYRPNIESLDVFQEGKEIRYNEKFSPHGTNVNFVEILANDTISVRTYERGVENETLSCGTGVTAAAIGASTKGISSPVKIKTFGGVLNVSFNKTNEGYKNIYLSGPATPVFEGSIEI